MSNHFYRNAGLIGGLIIVAAIGFLMHRPVLKKDLTGFHVWRQTQTQNTILSFAYEDANILNPRKNERGAGEGIFRMEFPLMQWVLSKPIKWGADSITTVRLGSFILSILSMIGIFSLVRKLFKQSVYGLIAAVLFVFSPVIYYYSVNPMPDNMALCLAIWGLLSFINWREKGQIWYLITSGALFSLAGLVKLPFILYMIIPGVTIVLDRKWRLLIPLIGLSLPFFAWYAWVIPGWKDNAITEGIFGMTEEQKAQVLTFLWFHVRTTLPELLLGIPVLLLFIPGTVKLLRRFMQHWKSRLAWLLTIVALALFILLEINMIEKVHDYYFMPFVPLLIIVSVVGYQWLVKWAGRRFSWMLIVILVALPVYSWFRINPRWEETGFNRDFYTYRDEIRESIPEGSLVYTGNDRSHHIFLYYIGRNGWVFENDWLTEKELRTAISQGCEFLITDSRAVDQNPVFIKYFGTEVDRYGSIRIYSLINN